MAIWNSVVPLWATVLLLTVLSCSVSAQLLLNEANPGFVTDFSPYVCTTRGDCCAKAIACLRHIAYVGFYDNTLGTQIDSACVYPKCRQGFKYNGPAASDATSGTCDRFIPFRGVAKHAPFTSWDQCMGDCNGVPHDPTDGGFCAPSLLNEAGAGNVLYTNRHCMAAFLEAHEECIYQSISMCYSGFTTDEFCVEPNFQFDDWQFTTDVESAYPERGTISPSPSP